MSTSCSKALLFFRRAYSVVGTEAMKVAEAGEGNINNIVGKGKLRVVGVEVGKEVFWMKDPKTGNWLPETHFDQVDAAELREKFLSKCKASKS